MEDKDLEAFFKDVIDKTEKKGYPPVVVRESFDRVAPPLPWQHNWLILFILVAGVLFGLLAVPFVLLASVFAKGPLFYASAAFLLGSAGFLFYFALSAFNIHEWAKLVFTLLASAIVAAGAYAGHLTITLLLAPLRAQVAKVSSVAQAASSFGLEVPGADLIQSFSFELIGVPTLLLIILASYNLWPLIFWAKERWEARARTPVDEAATPKKGAKTP